MTVAAESANVSRHLAARAEEHPERCAVRAADGRALTFAEMEARVRRIGGGLRRLGLERGERACLFVPPGPDLIAITYALQRIGAVPVLIDPGMGRRNLLASVERIRPRALIAVPRAHVARRLFPRSFRSVELLVTVGRRLAWGGTTLADLERSGGDALPGETAPDDEAAVLFTSGSTGPPKGVAYTHGNFEAQLAALRELYDLRPGETDVACFPLFALFDNALGMTSVFPELDPSRPGRCDPAKVFGAVEASGATFTFGSPAIWRRVLPWARANGRRFATLRRITIAGAPVPPPLVAGLRELLPAGGDVHTPYGATEALPVANVSGAELADGLAARTLAGEGTCVGFPAPGVDVRAIRITDDAIARWSDDLEVPRGELGELCVRSPVVTREYKFEPGPTAAAKIAGDAGLWHRMGDVGYVDGDGRIWFCGRKAHRLETEDGLLMPVPVENVYNPTPGVHRTALVGVGPRGSERPVLVVEPEPRSSRRELPPRLREPRPHSDRVTDFLFHPAFPVDVRHNAKIHREELKRWAERKLR